MLSKELINKKNKLEKLMKNSKNDFELLAKLRIECERLDIINNEIILDYNKAKFTIKNNKVKSIVTFDESLNKFKEFHF